MSRISVMEGLEVIWICYGDVMYFYGFSMWESSHWRHVLEILVVSWIVVCMS